MSINGDCPYCGRHSTDAEWDTWNGECQWCGEFDVEWERSGGKDKGEAEDDDCDYNELDSDFDRNDYGWDEDDD